MNLMRIVFLLIVVPALLFSCSSGEQETVLQEADAVSDPIPTKKRIGLDILPIALTEVKPRAVDYKSHLSLSKSEKRKQLKAQRNVKGQTIAIDEGEYDPFSTILENKTDSNCGAAQVFLPKMREVEGISANSYCLVAIAKLALHRGAAHYSNFSQLLPEIVDELQISNTAPATEHEYNQSAVTAYGTDGFKVVLFHDKCAAQQSASVPDADALAFCQQSPLGAHYYRIKVFPLSPTRVGLTTDTAIGKMEWHVEVDGTIDGKMVVARHMMSQVNEVYTPRQMQFEFRADSSGEYKDIVIKFERDINAVLPDFYTNEWNANVLHVSRTPATNDEPALWMVRGSSLIKLDLSDNPVASDSLWPGTVGDELHKTSEPRIFFTAVADDVFIDGHAVFSVILGDGPGLDLSDYPQSQWDQEFHLWAAYKKLLQHNFTEEHYLNEHRLGEVSSVHLFEKDTGNIVRWLALEGHSDSVNDLETSADGNRLASASSDGTVRIWNIDQASPTYGDLIANLSGMPVVAEIDSVAFHPSDSDLVAVTGDNGMMRVLRISTQAEVIQTTPGLLQPSLFKLRVAWSDDGTRLLTTSDTGVKIWNAATGALLHTLDDGISLESRAARFYPNSNNLVLSGHESGDVHRWNLNSPSAPEATFLQAGVTSILDLQFAPSGTTFAAVSFNGPIYVWNIGNTTVPQSAFIPDIGLSTRYAKNAEYSSDGQILYLQSDNEMLVYNLMTSKSDVIYIGEGGADAVDGLVSFTMMPDESMILVGHNRAANQPSLGVDIEAYNVVTRSVTPTFQGHVGDVNMGVFSPDGLSILTAGDDGTVRLWETATGTMIRQFSGHTNKVNSAKFNSDGSRIVSASEDGTVRIWNTTTGAEIVPGGIDHNAGAAVNYAEFSPDDSIVISAGDDDFLRGWDAVSGAPSGVITSLTSNSEYTWQQSVTNPNEHYLIRTTNLRLENSTLAGGNPFFTQPDYLWLSNVEATMATAGSLANNQWGFGNNDGLGFNTVYVNFAGADPNTLGPEVQHILAMTQQSSSPTEMMEAYFTGDPNGIILRARSGFSELRTVTNMDTARCQINLDNYFKPAADGMWAITIGTFRTELVSLDPTNASTFCETFFGTTSVSAPINTNHAFTTPDMKELFVSGDGRYIQLFDIDSASPTYEQRIDPLYADTRGVGTTSWRQTQYSALSPDGTLILGTESVKPFDATWIDFDGYFNTPQYTGMWDEFGQPITMLLPDENDNANPYYVSSELFTQEWAGQTYLTGCLEFDVDPESPGYNMCAVLCEDVGGCMTYNVKSQHDFDTLGTTPDPAKYGHLKTRLDSLTSPWLLDKYIGVTID